jgi:hypothetical protein
MRNSLVRSYAARRMSGIGISYRPDGQSEPASADLIEPAMSGAV